MSNHNQFSLHVIIFSVIGYGDRVHPPWNMHSLIAANRNVFHPDSLRLLRPSVYKESLLLTVDENLSR